MGCVGDYDGDLAELRHHWASAYLITRPEPGTWLAQRRDDRSVLHAGWAGELLEKIRADYAQRPVSRHTGGADRPRAQGCRSRPGGVKPDGDGVNARTCGDQSRRGQPLPSPLRPRSHLSQGN
jgi:hypothetical protein